MSLYQLEFTCGDRSFRVQRSASDGLLTHDDIKLMLDQSCAALGFDTPAAMRGQEITVKLIGENDPAFLLMEAADAA